MKQKRVLVCRIESFLGEERYLGSDSVQYVFVDYVPTEAGRNAIASSSLFKEYYDAYLVDYFSFMQLACRGAFPGRIFVYSPMVPEDRFFSAYFPLWMRWENVTAAIEHRLMGETEDLLNTHFLTNTHLTGTYVLCRRPDEWQPFKSRFSNVVTSEGVFSTFAEFTEMMKQSSRTKSGVLLADQSLDWFDSYKGMRGELAMREFLKDFHREYPGFVIIRVFDDLLKLGPNWGGAYELPIQDWDLLFEDVLDCLNRHYLRFL